MKMNKGNKAPVQAGIEDFKGVSRTGSALFRDFPGPPVDIFPACGHIPPMSQSLMQKSRIIGSKIWICVVASKYNDQYADALVQNAIEELGELVPR